MSIDAFWSDLAAQALRMTDWRSTDRGCSTGFAPVLSCSINLFMRSTTLPTVMSMSRWNAGLLRCRSGFRGMLGEIDHPTGALQKPAQRAIHRFHGIHGGHVPARGRPEGLVAVRQPKRTSRALDQVGECMDAALLDTLRRTVCR